MGTKEELALQVDEAEWEWLRPHLERDGLILVAQGLDLAEAGAAMAADDAAVVGEWISKKKVGKPAPDQVKEWDRLPKKIFLMLVISPWVLIQER